MQQPRLDPLFSTQPVAVPIHPRVSILDFQGYIQFKVLDNIAYPGTYKKFLYARKEQGHQWAIDLHAKYQAVVDAIKDMEQHEQHLKHSKLAPLHIIWQHVAESNLPPSDLQLTIANCVISNKTNVPCVIIKGKGRGAQPFPVNSRFVAFLYDLWIVYKIDILIKTFVKHCIDDLDQGGQLPMATIVENLQTTKHDDIHLLASALHAAFSHVYASTMYGIQALV
jgi:hypothetical protein